MDPKDEIKQKTDIAELIAGYVTLKPAGMASFKGLCPFHAEKTPSFHVSTDKQIWHCFGCSEGGDCFSFLMKIEGMDFPEALRHLGEKVGVEVKRFDSAATNDRQRLIAVNELAARFFRKVLSDSPAAEKARSYVAQRGIPEDLLDKFGIGYAPDSWDTLSLFLAKKGYREGDGEHAGLTQRRKQGSGTIDRFRNRLMIPLRDQHGNTVGFTGRVLLPALTNPQLPNTTSQDGPKYMNTPETALYRKGEILFGLDLAKQAIKRAGYAIVVEGNLDVVASHKAGVENVVASSGTADQLVLLKRFTDTIVFSFDRDAAGFKAAQKGIALARAQGFDVRATVLPSEAGKDPDEAVQKNPELWRAAAGKSVPIMQFTIERAVAGRDLGNVDEKRAVSAMLLPELKLITDVVEREHWLQTVADLLRTDIGALRNSIAGGVGQGSSVIARRPQPTKQSPGEIASSPSRPSTSSGNKAPRNDKKEETSARILVGLASQDAKAFKLVHDAKLAPDMMPEPWATLYSLLGEEYHRVQTDPPDPRPLFGRLRSRLEAQAQHMALVPVLDLSALEAEQLLASVAPKDLPGQVTELVRTLVAADAKRRRKTIEEDIRRAERVGDHATVERLIIELTSLR